MTEPLPHPAEDQTPKREARRPRRLLAVVGAGALFLAGTGVGVAVGHPAPARAPSPVVHVAPQSCLDALGKAELAMEHARTGFGYTAELMGISGDGFTAASRSDVDGLTDAATRMNEVNEKITELTPQMSVAVSEYQTAAASCRAAA